MLRQEQRYIAHLIQASPQLAGEPGDRLRVGRPINPPTHTPTGCTDRPPSRATTSLPAFLIRSERFHRPVVGGHADGDFKAEEVGQVQQEHVQHVALDPLAAIQHVAQHADRRIDLVEHAHGLLQGVAGAHLIGDRTDAADAGRDVGHFLKVSAAEECLEKPRRLVNLQLQLFHLAVGMLDAAPLPLPPGPTH